VFPTGTSLNSASDAQAAPSRRSAAVSRAAGTPDFTDLQERLAKFQLLETSETWEWDAPPPETQALAAALTTGNLEEKEALAAFYFLILWPLLKRRADISICAGDLQRTALHVAAEKCYVKLIEELLKHRADPNRADRAGETALFAVAHSVSWSSAAPRHRRATVQRLVEGEADINFSNPRGRMPLHVAVSCKDASVLSALLDELADVNAKDLGGFTALMWAAGRGSAEQVQQLLDAKAESDLVANRGQTALVFALTNNCEEVVEILKKRAAAADHQAKVPPQHEQAESRSEMHMPFLGQVGSRFAPDLSSNSYGAHSAFVKKDVQESCSVRATLFICFIIKKYDDPW
ncbi:unnamed protein product, partial [Cladocopium goreaui]